MKILFTTKTHEYLYQQLSDAGFNCEINLLKDKVELEKIIFGYDGIVINSRFVIDKQIIDKAINLKFVARVGAGMESIDVEYLNEKGVKCYNSPEGNRDAVGEHALGMLLCLLNKIKIADSQVRQGKWIREENRGIEIMEKTVGIIGYGNMGGAFAMRLKGFCCEVIAYDKYKKDYSDNYVKESTLNEVFEKSDIVSIHVPLTEETHYMIDDEFINSFKKNIYLINTSRGKVVNTECLVNNLKTGKIIGAALDVLEYEGLSFENFDFNNAPDAFKYLINCENIILTPHIAGWSVESNFKHAKVLADKILADFR